MSSHGLTHRVLTLTVVERSSFAIDVYKHMHVHVYTRRVNDRLSATMKLRTRLYEDRTSAANASDSEG